MFPTFQFLHFLCTTCPTSNTPLSALTQPFLVWRGCRHSQVSEGQFNCISIQSLQAFMGYLPALHIENLENVDFVCNSLSSMKNPILSIGIVCTQTKRWAEGIRVPGPLAGGGSTTARGKLRLCPASVTDSMDLSLSELQELVMDREAWRAVIHGVAKSWTQLSDFHPPLSDSPGTSDANQTSHRQRSGASPPKHSDTHHAM